MSELLYGLVLKDPQLMVDNKELYLKGCRCEECFHVMFPRMELCLNCTGNRLADIAIGKEGAVKAFTISYVPPEGFEAPLIQSLVVLNEGPEVFSLIETDMERAKELSAGVKLSLVPVISEAAITGWKYKPVWEGTLRHE